MRSIAATSVLSLFLAGTVFGQSPGTQPDDAKRAAQANASDVLESEEVIETLRMQLHALSKSAMNLRMPDSKASALFEPNVLVVGLAQRPSAEIDIVLDLDVKKRNWPVAEKSSNVSSAGLSLWSGFMRGVDFFHHAKFYTVRGSFVGEDKSSFRAVSGFKGLAQLKSGEMAAVKADMTIVWTGDAASKGEGWRISAILTNKFQMVMNDRPFFSDAFEGAVTEEDRKRARRSMRDEGLIDWILSINRGELKLEDALKTNMDQTLDGTAPFPMSHVCVVDIDRDGFDDFFVCPSDSVPMFFRNKGDGTFEEIAEELGLAHELTEAAIFADFDNDGDADAFLSFYPNETKYFLNEGGRFVERGDLIDGELPQLVIAISPMDYNNDGLLDVYFSRYNGGTLGVIAARMEKERAQGLHVEPKFPGMDDQEASEIYQRLFSESSEPFTNRPGPKNRLFTNLGNGRFAHAENPGPAEQYTQSMSSTWSDFDGDGDMDLYVVTEAAPNQLIRNDGGSFTDITNEETSDVGFGMGLGFGDYNNDGRQDIYVTNMYSKAGQRISGQMGANEQIARAAAGNSLFRNEPGGFRRVSGVHEPDILVEAADFGWGGAFVDLNNDGVLDLYAPAGFLSMPLPVASVGET